MYEDVIHHASRKSVAYAAVPIVRPRPTFADGSSLARLFARRPTFVMFSRRLRPDKPRGAELQADVDPALAAEYRLVSLWLEDFANGEAGWFSFLERNDRGRSGG